ncbi:MAG: preprotein translocase subunit SecG [Bacteroidetes bacterium]|nr:preprotein translocase subunit SecG [Bacteroidota bacterium]MDA0844211.1 preprotein translocase subunit SecG [Bacteroidota bacterium]
MSTFSLFLILIIAVSLLLILVIMVQNPKGGGLSSSFGGSTQVVGGVKNTNDFLDKTTWTLATLVVALILLSNVSLKSSFGEGESKVLDGSEAPIEEVAPIETPVELPTAPADESGTE